ncbi:hypothetical protein CF139_02470 [Aeromonas hydrophila]|nr:hypothetical protein CF139_02470 [Aeromonas hydrophila]
MALLRRLAAALWRFAALSLRGLGMQNELDGVKRIGLIQAGALAAITAAIVMANLMLPPP